MSYKDITDWRNFAPERIAKFDMQLEQRGFDDTDWWSLYTTIAKFTLPRLKTFKDGTMSFPACMTSEEWDTILDSMILAFEIMLDENRWPIPNDADSEAVQNGCELFGKWFTHLWS